MREVDRGMASGRTIRSRESMRSGAAEIWLGVRSGLRVSSEQRGRHGRHVRVDACALVRACIASVRSTTVQRASHAWASVSIRRALECRRCVGQITPVAPAPRQLLSIDVKCQTAVKFRTGLPPPFSAIDIE